MTTVVMGRATIRVTNRSSPHRNAEEPKTREGSYLMAAAALSFLTWRVRRSLAVARAGYVAWVVHPRHP
jgi:hypothetical protein